MYENKLEVLRAELRSLFDAHHNQQNMSDFDRNKFWYDKSQILSDIGTYLALQEEARIRKEALGFFLAQNELQTLKEMRKHSNLFKDFGAYQPQGSFDKVTGELKEVHLFFPDHKTFDGYTIVISQYQENEYDLRFEIVQGAAEPKENMVLAVLRENKTLFED